jgi:hypothetical protein
MSAVSTQVEGAGDWLLANRQFLELELLRLRLLLRRRALWLRTRWAHDSVQDYLNWKISDAQAESLLCGENRDEEALFYESDDAALQVNSLLAQTRQQISQRRVELEAAGMQAAIDVLVLLFGLTELERDIFLLALAPELDSSFERLYAYLEDDVTKRLATPQLALSLFRLCHNEADQSALTCFLPDGALRRYRLIATEESTSPLPFSGRPMRVGERMLNFVLGVNRPDDRIASLMEPVPAGLITSSQQVLVSKAVAWLQSAPERLPARTVNLTGISDAKPHLAHAICDGLGMAVSQVNAPVLLVGGNDFRESLRLIEREAVLLQTALFIDLTSLSREERSKLITALATLRALSIVSSSGRWSGARETFTLAMSPASRTEQSQLWHEALAARGIAAGEAINAVVEQFDLGASQIARAVDTALESAGSPSVLQHEDLWRACKEETVPELDELAQRIPPCFGWNDIVLPQDARQQLKEIENQVAHRVHVYQTWGFGARLNRGRGISALFAGPSGAGKTMAAEVLANSLNLDLYRIDLAGVVSKYIGETEKNLRRIFDAAECGGALVFFDEADALFGKRSEVKDSHDRYANIEVNYLLQRMEEFRGLAILATNRKSSLDSAFVRRLRFIVDFPFPDTAHRLRIWQTMFPRQAELQEVDFSRLALLEISGGHIRNIALAAAFVASSEKTPITMVHIMKAARREYVKMEKIVHEADFEPYYHEVLA